jgi:hypothetical protein
MREDLSPWTAPPGTLRSAQNVRFFRQDIAEQRWGTVAIGKTGEFTALPLTSGEGVGFIASRGQIGMLGTGGCGFAYDDVAGTWQYVGRYASSLIVRKRRALWTEDSISGPPSTVTAGGVVATAMVDGGGRCQLIIERDDGTTIIKAEVAGVATKLVVQGSNIYWLYQVGTAINMATIFGSAYTNLSVTGLVATLNGISDHWDADGFSSTQWCLIYRSGAALTTVNLLASNVVGSTATFATTASPDYSIYGDGTNVWAGVNDNPAAAGARHVRCYSNALALVAGPTALGAAAARTGPPIMGPAQDGAGFAEFAYGEFAAGAAITPDEMHSGSYSTAGAVVSYQTAIGVWPWSRPDQGRIWCQAATRFVSTTSAKIRTVLLRRKRTVVNEPYMLEIASDQSLGGAATGTGVIGPRNFTKPRQKTDLNWVVGTAVILRRGNPVAASQLAGIDVLEYSNSSVEASRDTTSTPEAIVVAGQPTELLGDRGSSTYENLGVLLLNTGGAEIGFAGPPSVQSIAGSVAAGALTALATYTYKLTYEWVDSLGRRHISEPTDPIAATLAGGQNTITIVAVQLDWHTKVDVNLTCLSGPPRFHAYRLVTADGLYHRVSPDAFAPSAVAASPTFVDLMADTVAATQEQLYTAGEVLPNRLAPACRYVAEGGQRLWCAGLANPRIIECSKLRFPTEPYSFTNSESHQIFLEDDCTGIACQDGMVFGFTKRGVYVWSGDGPNDQGLGAFSPPRLLSGDLGLVDYRSILETAVGIAYQANETFALVPRGGGVPVLIGKAVPQTLGTYPTCIGACMAEQTGERTARFLMQGAGGITRELVWHVADGGAWAFDVRTSFTTIALGAWPKGPLFARALSNTLPFLYERHDVAQLQLDNATRIDMILRFADIRPFGRVGCGHFRGIFAFVELWNPGTSSGLVARLFKQDAQAQLLVGSITDQYARFVPEKFQAESAIGISLEESVDTAEVKSFCGLQLELDPMEGPRRNVTQFG